jgi:hypothetical protein
MTAKAADSEVTKAKVRKEARVTPEAVLFKHLVHDHLDAMSIRTQK